MSVSEMVVAHTLLENSRESQRIATFDPNERIRSAQLYAVHPDTAGRATQLLIDRYGAHHVDLNYGCPVRKVTAKGGGAALAARPALLAAIVRSCVAVAGPAHVPVTIKIRIGLTDAIQTYVDAALFAQDAGAAAVTLHARTAEEQYIPGARWEFIHRLKEQVSIPVIGNGDVYTGEDAVRMMRETGADGVMIGRASLGRPWVFAEMAAALRGDPVPPPPPLAVAVAAAHTHFRALVGHFDGDEKIAALEFRKLAPLYLLGFKTAEALKRRWSTCVSAAEFAAAIARDDWDPTEPFDRAFESFPRLKGERMKRQSVSLPPGWLDEGARLSLEVPAALERAEACEG